MKLTSRFLGAFLFLLLCAPAFAQTLGGIGAMLSLDSTGGYTLPYIVSIIPNSPAAKALKEKIFIQSVNGESCKGRSMDDVVGLIRGTVGTPVKIRASDDKMGMFSSEYELVRAGIATPAGTPAPDPVAAFYAGCEQQVHQMKRQGAVIVKTYNSEAGDFFFNFNAGAGTYHARVLCLADKGSAQGMTVGATLFDNNNEAGAQPLHKGPDGAKGIAVLEGDISFTKDGVGVVHTHIPADNTVKCLAMYVVVFK